MAKAILLAEDSQDDETLFKRTLRMARLENPIFVVRDGDEAIAYLKGEGDFADRDKHPLPAVLFLDLKMRRVNGQEVLRWIGTQPHLREMLVIVLSHFGDSREINQAYSLGAKSFLTKPCTQADLDNLIAHFHSYWIQSPGDSKSKGP